MEPPPKYTKSILVRLPPEQVFAYVAEPNNLPAFFPFLMQVTVMARFPGGGYRTRSVMDLGETHVEFGTETTEYVLNRRLAGRNDDGGAWVWEFRPEGDGTRVMASGESPMPAALVGRSDEATWEMQMEPLIETLLANLKARLESRVATGR